MIVNMLFWILFLGNFIVVFCFLDVNRDLIFELVFGFNFKYIFRIFSREYGVFVVVRILLIVFLVMWIVLFFGGLFRCFIFGFNYLEICKLNMNCGK